jgi:hypothetical protein
LLSKYQYSTQLYSSTQKFFIFLSDMLLLKLCTTLFCDILLDSKEDDMFKEETMSEGAWKALAEKERLEAARRAAFEAELAAEKVAKVAERAEAVEAFVAFGCGEAWEAEKMLLRTVEAHVFGASEEE